MIEFYVSGQSMKLYTPVIAADTLHYLTGRVYFAGHEWEGFSKWLHFRQGEGPDALVFDAALDENDELPAERQLNLTRGEWTVYLTGTREQTRLTTQPLMLTVKESGLIDAPLHPMPLSVAEQIDSKASTALSYAAALRAAAEAGKFNGRDGQSFVISGYFDTPEQLRAAIPEPQPGEAYGVGTAAPYDIYVWDGLNGQWRNNGCIQGVAGERGENGVTFVPTLDANGNLSWNNDGGRENPPTQNIRGPAGAAGQPGPAGKAPYEAAAEAGYTGTEATFYAALAAIPYHNARHLPEGADPILVQTDNLTNGAVTAAKVRADSRTQYLELPVPAEWSGTGPYTQTLAVEGLRETDRPKVHFRAPESFGELENQQDAFGQLYDVVSAQGAVTLYAKIRPDAAFAVTLEVTRI